MKKKTILQKTTVLTVVLATILLIPGSVESVHGNSKFKGREDYWQNYCSQTFTSAAAAKDCYDFQNYLKQKGNSLGELNKEIDAKIASIKDDIKVIEKEADVLKKELDSLDGQISTLESQISEMEANIKALEIQIKKNLEAIAKKDQDIKARMVNSQSFVNTNGYVDFIMGAKDFTDLLERISVMDQITTYENGQIKQLNKDIKQLDHDKKEAQRQQEMINIQKQGIETKKAEVEEKKRYQDALIAQARRKEADLFNEILQNEAHMNEIIASIPNIKIEEGSIPPSSTGWGSVVSGYKSAGTWYYNGGGYHPGLDIAGPVGTAITAPINGAIGYTRDGYPTYGSIASPLGYANMIVMVGEVNGRTYGVLLGHLKQGGVAVTPGQVVSQGQIIGYRGSSGTSSGPHTHIEVFDLGTVGINGGLQILKNSGYGFGLYYNSSSQCDYRGAPCRVRPENYIPH